MPAPQRAPVRVHGTVPAHLIPFDPEELTRRLYIVQAEQKAYSERKRRAKVEAERQAKAAGVGDLSERKARAKGSTARANAARAHTKDNPEKQKSHDHISPTHQSASKQIQQLDETATTSTKSAAKVNDNRPSSPYHHIPQVAASQFTRTTTAGNPDDAHVHSLSKKAMKFHLDGPNADQDLRAAESNLAPRDTVRTLRRVQSQREEQYERNQFQHPSMLDSVVEIDDERLRLAQRHTFETSFGKEEHNRENDFAHKRLSAGANHFAPVFAELPHNALHLDRTNSRDFAAVGNTAQESRVDWTQSDESSKSPGNTAPSLLRKVDSKWNLTGRFAKSQKHSSKPRTLSSPAEESIGEDTPISPKSPKPGFFSRFKR